MTTNIERPKAKAKEPSTDAPNDKHRYQRVQKTYEEAIKQDEVIERALSNELDNIKKIAVSLGHQNINKIFILGCGDSWFSGIGVRLTFEKLLNISTEPMQALDFSLYYHESVDENTLVFGISSSGNTEAVMSALHQAKSHGAMTIGVTNTQGSPITKEFDFALHVDAIRKGWPTQASTATMAVLIQFAIKLAEFKGSTPNTLLDRLQEELNHLPEVISKVLDVSENPIKALANKLFDVRFFFLCGGGSNFACAAFGAAKIKELCPIHAYAIPLEEFHHYRSLKPGDPLFLIASDQISHKRALDTTEVGRYDGGQIYTIIPEGEQEINSVAKWSLELPEVNPVFSSIIYSVPLHLFAYYLAMAKFDHGLGHTPAFPESIGKI